MWTDSHGHPQKQTVAALIYKDTAVGILRGHTVLQHSVNVFTISALKNSAPRLKHFKLNNYRNGVFYQISLLGNLTVVIVTYKLPRAVPCWWPGLSVFCELSLVLLLSNFYRLWQSWVILGSVCRSGASEHYAILSRLKENPINQKNPSTKCCVIE